MSFGLCASISVGVCNRTIKSFRKYVFYKVEQKTSKIVRVKIHLEKMLSCFHVSRALIFPNLFECRCILYYQSLYIDCTCSNVYKQHQEHLQGRHAVFRRNRQIATGTNNRKLKYHMT